MAEKLKDLVNGMTLEYILWHKAAETAKKQKYMPFNKEILNFISKKDSSFLERIEGSNTNPAFSDNEFEEIMHNYGAIIFYNLFEKALQKKDGKYFAYVKREIHEKAGNAEIDIDYLERLLPYMKSLNVMFGVYNKEYTLDDKETISFGYSISTGGRKTKEVSEGGVIIPYNLRMKNKITASA